ncbi:MAG TPA: GGDEF domain-containing protein, partial [Sphingobium sp.]
INNREGHLAGDDVLRTFAKGASSIIRREDLIGRIGGDEFALLVRVPSIAEGQGFARDLHARLSAVLAEGRHPVTCSMGALLISPHAPRDAGELMHAADLAMYRAKQTGKNAVEIGRADEPGLAPIARQVATPRTGIA